MTADQPMEKNMNRKPNETRLLPLLERYAPTMLPMHMPGGKRRFAGHDGHLLPYGLDVTEVEGLDDLHHPRGVLLALEERASALWGAEKSFVLVNGSTVGLLAAVRGTGSGRILLARNCHRAVYNAAELCRREISYVLPERTGEVTPEAVNRALAERPEITSVVITSPTYEGVISDVAGISAVCKVYGATLIVDEAHGAHLAFFPGTEPLSALQNGADIVVQSLHKTLPALTQTAVLHCRAPFAEALRRELGVFETSSPSYILLASADACFAFLEERGREEMLRYGKALADVRERLAGELKHLRLFAPRDPAFYDPGKLLLLTGGTDLTGERLAERLRREFAIETEYSLPDRLLAMTSVCDDEGTLNRFAEAVLAIDRGLHPASSAEPFAFSVSIPEQVFPAFAAREVTTGRGFLPFQEAVGKVALEFLWAYPPGIPLLCPGERVEKHLPPLLSALADSGVSLRTSGDRFPLLEVSVLP
ncbi:MAG: aminotransferase class I/II-fold pyridoxal phosphate-dependent enzyme [Oscillospiraceae bacterium]|nr:aminotransferase class I/II-fold pyridoxal phosphate-dependent enzyme [Oscillospiraceae bacterium]